MQVGDEFVTYSPEAAAAIVDASPFEEGRTEGDLAIAIDRTSEEAGVYPIVLVSYMIACEEYDDPAIAALVKGFLQYVASPEGQEAAAAGRRQRADLRVAHRAGQRGDRLIVVE